MQYSSNDFLQGMQFTLRQWRSQLSTFSHAVYSIKEAPRELEAQAFKGIFGRFKARQRYLPHFEKCFNSMIMTIFSLIKMQVPFGNMKLRNF